MGDVTYITPCDRIRQQRDELLEAAKRIRPEYNTKEDWYRLQAAIGRAEGDGPDGPGAAA